MIIDTINKIMDDTSIKICQELSQQGLKALPGVNCIDEPIIMPESSDKFKFVMPIANERPILGLDFNLATAL